MEDEEFLQLSEELQEMGYDGIYNALGGTQGFYCKYNFSLEVGYNLCLELNKGYPMENPYHNQMHIIDSLQAMHFFMTTCNL